MLFLSVQEKIRWARYAKEIAQTGLSPVTYEGKIRKNLYSAFCFYIGSQLAALGHDRLCIEWLEAGAKYEEDGLFSSKYLMGFLQRHNGKMIKPAIAFEDRRPFVHFSNVPIMKTIRKQLVHQCTHSLPSFDQPVRFMDIGCGDGGLTVMLLSELLNSGKVNRISEIHLIDPSPAMIALAKKTVGDAFPAIPITTENARIQDCSAGICNHYDIAFSSLAYHHMPIEDKRIHLARLKPWIDHFVLFEMDANNDTPELFSPDLAFSVYQSYGRMIAFVFAQDAPFCEVTDCVDSFLMTEVVSILTEPRGERTDYHMLSSQWNDLFNTVLGPEFVLQSHSPCYADEYMALFTMHYGRDE
ncbi:MAG: class I SAM-dependent methyltransferase [Methanoregula sp.]|nr:class I SAM-dependent methyltransferase [Methanoregula sp.]